MLPPLLGSLAHPPVLSAVGALDMRTSRPSFLRSTVNRSTLACQILRWLAQAVGTLPLDFVKIAVF